MSMSKKQKIRLSDNEKVVDVPKDSTRIAFRFEIECARSAVDAMRHHMEIAERCYQKGRDVYSVTMEEIT